VGLLAFKSEAGEYKFLEKKEITSERWLLFITGYVVILRVVREWRI